MKSLMITFTLFVMTFYYGKAQITDNFSQDFKIIADRNYPKKSVDSFFRKYTNIFFFFNPNAKLAASIKGQEISDYPLASFKLVKLYQDNIDLLLADTAYHKYILGCFLACATNDRSKIPKIESILTKSAYKNSWAAISLMILHTTHIPPLLKTIRLYEKQETFSYLLEPFLQLDAEVLEKFSLDSIKSKDLLMQYLSIRAMQRGGPTELKINLLKNVVSSGLTDLKGWAISVLASFHAPDMLSLVSPYLENTQLSTISLMSVAASSSKKDTDYIDSLFLKDNPNEVFLNALLRSAYEPSLKKWIKAVTEKNIPANYYPWIENSGIMENDTYFEEICQAITHTKNPQVVSLLFTYFLKREDEKSILYLISCLSDPNLKQHAAGKLKGKKNHLIKESLPLLMKNANITDIGLVELLIDHHNKDYHHLIRKWLQTPALQPGDKYLLERYLNQQ